MTPRAGPSSIWNAPPRLSKWSSIAQRSLASPAPSPTRWPRIRHLPLDLEDTGDERAALGWVELTTVLAVEVFAVRDVSGVGPGSQDAGADDEKCERGPSLGD